MHAGDGLMTAHPLSGRTGPQPALHFFDANHRQALESLHRSAHLPADVVVVGHGPPFRGTPEETVSRARAS